MSASSSLTLAPTLSAGPLSLCFAPLTRQEFVHCLVVSKQWNAAARLRSAWPAVDIKVVAHSDSYRPTRSYVCAFSLVEAREDDKAAALLEKCIATVSRHTLPGAIWRETRAVAVDTVAHECFIKLLEHLPDWFPSIEYLLLELLLQTKSTSPLVAAFFRRVAPTLTVLRLDHSLGTELLNHLPLLSNLRVLHVWTIYEPAFLLSMYSLEHLKLTGWEHEVSQNRRYGREFQSLLPKIVQTMRAIRRLSVEHRLRSLTVLLESTLSLKALVDEDPNLAPAALTHLSVQSIADDHEYTNGAGFTFQHVLGKLPQLTSFRTNRQCIHVLEGEVIHQQEGLKRFQTLDMQLGSFEDEFVSLSLFDFGRAPESPKLILDHTPNLTKLILRSEGIPLDYELKKSICLARLPLLREFIWLNVGEERRDKLSSDFLTRFSHLRELELLVLPIDPEIILKDAAVLVIFTNLPKLVRFVFKCVTRIRPAATLDLFDASVLKQLAKSTSLRSVEVTYGRHDGIHTKRAEAECRSTLVPGVFEGLTVFESEQLLRLRVWFHRAKLHRSYRLQRSDENDARWLHADTGEEVEADASREPAPSRTSKAALLKNRHSSSDDTDDGVFHLFD